MPRTRSAKPSLEDEATSASNDEPYDPTSTTSTPSFKEKLSKFQYDGSSTSTFVEGTRSMTSSNPRGSKRTRTAATTITKISSSSRPTKKRKPSKYADPSKYA